MHTVHTRENPKLEVTLTAFSCFKYSYIKFHPYNSWPNPIQRGPRFNKLEYTPPGDAFKQVFDFLATWILSRKFLPELQLIFQNLSMNYPF